MIQNIQGSHLVNWGAFTASSKLLPGPVVAFCLGTFTLDQRRMFEAIAWNVRVMEPDGEWNCQNWVAAVLSVAVERGLISAAKVREVIGNALGDRPVGEESHPFKPLDLETAAKTAEVNAPVLQGSIASIPRSSPATSS